MLGMSIERFLDFAYRDKGYGISTHPVIVEFFLESPLNHGHSAHSMAETVHRPCRSKNLNLFTFFMPVKISLHKLSKAKAYSFY